MGTTFIVLPGIHTASRNTTLFLLFISSFLTAPIGISPMTISGSAPIFILVPSFFRKSSPSRSSMSPSSIRTSPSTLVTPSDTDSQAAPPGVISLPSIATRRFFRQGVITSFSSSANLDEHTDTPAPVSITADTLLSPHNTSWVTMRLTSIFRIGNVPSCWLPPDPTRPIS